MSFRTMRWSPPTLGTGRSHGLKRPVLASRF